MRRFYLPDARLNGPEVLALDGEESAHAARALRLRPGDEARVFDGRGREYLVRMEAVSPHRTMVRLQEEVAPTSAETAIPVTLAFGLIKRPAAEWLIQKAVELGVQTLRPFVSQYAVVKPSERWDGASPRWSRIIRDSAKQCGRAVLCDVRPVVGWSELLEATSDATRYVCWEKAPAGDLLSRAPFTRGNRQDGEVALIIGPEGGLTAEEVHQARDRGAHICSLGPRTLRAETASLAALAAVLVQLGEL